MELKVMLSIFSNICDAGKQVGGIQQDSSTVFYCDFYSVIYNVMYKICVILCGGTIFIVVIWRVKYQNVGEGFSKYILKIVYLYKIKGFIYI